MIVLFNNKRKIWIISTILFNLFWSFLYFKQLFYPDSQDYIINLSAIALLPFIYFVAVLSVLTIPVDRSKILTSPGMIWALIYTFGLFVLFATIGKYNYIVLLFVVITEPLKVKFIDNASIKHLKTKYISLALISFLLLSICTLLPKMNAPANATAMWMGGFYFLILLFLDLFFYKLVNKKVS